MATSIADDAIANILELAGGHPYYCQVLCAGSFREAVTASTNLISLAQTQSATCGVIRDHLERFRIGYWARLDLEERRFLAAVAAGEQPTGPRRRALGTRLADRFLIASTADGGYVFTAKLFEDWTRELVSREAEM